MTTSTLVYSTDGYKDPEYAILSTMYDDPYAVVCCLGQDGITSTSSCNRISVRVTGDWCPWCHPGDDVPISLAFE